MVIETSAPCCICARRTVVPVDSARDASLLGQVSRNSDRTARLMASTPSISCSGLHPLQEELLRSQCTGGLGDDSVGADGVEHDLQPWLAEERDGAATGEAC